MRRSFMVVVFVLFTFVGIAMAVAGEGSDRVIGIVSVLLFGFGGVGYVAGQHRRPEVAVEVGVTDGPGGNAVLVPVRLAKWLPMIVGGVGLGIGCVLLGVYAGVVADSGAEEWMLRVIGIGGGACFLVIAAGSLAGITRGAPKLALRPDGLAMTAGFGRSFVPWEIVRDVGVYELSVRGSPQRFAGVRTSDASRIDIPGWLRWLGALNRRMSGWDVTYPESTFDLSADQLAQLIGMFVEHPAMRRSASGLPPGRYSFEELTEELGPHLDAPLPSGHDRDDFHDRVDGPRAAMRVGADRGPGDPPLEGWWQPVPGSSSPDVSGKIEREVIGGRDELDALVRGIDAPEGSIVEITVDGEAVASAPLEHARRLFGGTDGRARITVDASSLPPMRAGDRVGLRVNGQPVAEAVLEPD